MSEHTPTIDPRICPLCGGPNGCAMASDPEARDCWCSHARIPDSLLDRIPPEAEGEACVCARCVADARGAGGTPGATS